MALTKVSGPLLHGSNDNLGNYVINNITGAAATFTGNVSVGGTLTYDDVTNVESVGLITAKSGIHVTGGSVRIGDNLSYTASTNADNLVIGETTGQHGMTILTGNNSSSINFADSAAVNPGAITYNHNGANYMRFRVAGGERVRITNTGDVGIGTTNPYTTGAASKHKLTVAADDVLGIGRENTDMFYVRREYEAGKYTFQTINGGNSGNFNFQPFGGVVGIGTKTPDTKLHITTTPADTSAATPLTLQRTHNNNVAVHYENPTLSMYAGLAGEGLGWAVGDGPDLGNPNNNKLMVTSAGRIGIGTIAPETNLTIAVNATNQTTATIPTVRLTNKDTTAVASDIVGSYEFFSKDTHSLNKVTGFMRNTPTDAGVNYDLTFGTIQTSDSNAVERVRITGIGSVGIGTANPNALLDIGGNTDGNIQAIMTRGSDTSFQLQFRNETSSNSANATVGMFGLFRNATDIVGMQFRRGIGVQPGSFSVTTGGSTKLLINPDGRLLISRSGLETSKNVGTKTGEIQVAAGGNNAAITLINFENSASSPYLMLGKSRAGNATDNTIVQENDRLGEIAFCGADGNDIDSFGAAIKAWVDGTPGDNNMPGRLVFYTTPSGQTATERMVIKGDGDVGIGRTDPAVKLDVKAAAGGGALRLRDSSAQYRYLDFDVTGALTSITARSNNSHGNISIGTTDQFGRTNQLYIKGGSTASVGIGTDDPDSSLEIFKGSEGTYLKIGGDDASNGRALTFTSSTGDTGSNGALHTLNATSGNGAIALATSGTERLLVDSDGNVTVQGGELGISTFTTNTSVLTFKNNVRDHKIGGVSVSVADDTISPDIQVPGARHGCLLFIFAHSDATGTYPQPGPVGMVYVDVGASTNIRPMFTQSGISSNATTNVGQLMVGKNSHETNINNCDDGKLTIMKGSANGRLKLANRLDDTYMFYLTMV